MFLKPYRSPDTPGSEGGGGSPTGTGAAGDATPIVAADATPTQTDAEKEAAEFEALSQNDKLDDAQKARFEALKGKYEVQYQGPDGKPLTPEQVKQYQELEKKFNELSAKDPATLTPDEQKFLKENAATDDDKKGLYEKVDELTGVKVEVDYGQVKPDSAEGIVMREEAIRKQTAAQFETNIKAKLPRAHQFMVHLMNGGSEADFFKPENQDFSKITLTKEDAAAQERMYRMGLALKGNSPDLIDIAVTAMKDKGQLFESAKAELEVLQKGQAQKEAQLAEAEEARKAKEIKDHAELETNFANALEKGFDGTFIPPVDRAGFAKFIQERISYQNGNFYMVKTINPKELNTHLHSAYFEYKKGNLKEYVERTAKTQQAMKFKNSLKPTVLPKGTGGSATGGKGYTPLSQL